MSISLNSSIASENSFSKGQPPKKKNFFDFEEVLLKNKTTSELGKGSYGCVKLVRDKTDNCLYAMKIVRLKP